MMKNSDSQLSYLSKRNKNYNKKYSILQTIIDKDIKTNSKILELFGGVGITTYLLQKYANPIYHKIFEIDEECYKLLKQNFDNCEILKSDSDIFIEEDYNVYNYIFHDRSFTPKKISELSKFINFKGKIILTDTGIFNLKFNKNRSIFDYFNELNIKLLEFGFYINKAFFTFEFSILIISKTKTKIEIIDCNNDKFNNDEWKRYVIKYIYHKQETFKLFTL